MKRRTGSDGRPWWPKYAKDWLTSETVLAMPRAARSLYDDLLSHQWLNGSLPSDVATLARMTGESVESFEELWDDVSACFDLCTDGRLRNPRLEEIRLENEEFRAAKVEAGKRGAEKTNGKRAADLSANERHSRTSADQSADTAADVLPTASGSANGRPPSSSSSASPEETESNSHSTRARATDPPAKEPSPHDAFEAWWNDRYAKLTASPSMPHGARYPWDNAEKSKVNRLLVLARENGRGLDLVQEVCERFIAHPKFGADTPTLGRFIANWALFVAAPVASKPAPVKASAPSAPADEKAVERAWHAKHETDLEVPGRDGKPMRVRGPDQKWPGYAAAKAELLADAGTKPLVNGVKT